MLAHVEHFHHRVVSYWHLRPRYWNVMSVYTAGHFKHLRIGQHWYNIEMFQYQLRGGGNKIMHGRALGWILKLPFIPERVPVKNGIKWFKMV